MRNESNDLNAASLHFLAVFEVTQYGRNDQDDLLNLVVKNIDNEEISGYEGGLEDIERALEEASSIDTPSFPRTFGYRKRKRDRRQEELMEVQAKLQREIVKTQKQFESIAVGLVDVFKQQALTGDSNWLKRKKR